MVEIRNNPYESLGRETQQARDRADEAVQSLIAQIRKDKANAVQLAKLEPAALSEPSKQALQTMLAEQMRGQLPAAFATALANGNANDQMLGGLLQRFANANDPNPQNRFGQATSPDAARAQATDQSTPQQALQWTQFVQKVTHIPGALVRERGGSAAPKGEGTSLLEIMGSRLSGAEGASLRLPMLVERAPGDLSPAQRLMLMNATFGEGLADKLMKLGVSDPLQFVRAGALPGDRSALAEALGMGRGELLTLLMRAELLRVGPGRNGELGIRPEFLLGLKEAGVAMLGTLGALRALTQEELTGIYKKLREAMGGFGRTSRGSRPVVKRDLIHWARSAARRPSDIMLTDREQMSGQLGRGDASELVQAWYLENLFWTELAAHKRIERDQQQRRDQQRQRNPYEDAQLDDNAVEPQQRDWHEEVPTMTYDEHRHDQLMCFWITDFNAHSHNTGIMRRMYVCIDPDSGAIIPQSIDAEYVSTQ